MIFDFNFYASTLLIFGVVKLIFGIALSNFKSASSKWMSLLFFTISIWIVGYAFELASNSLNQKLFFINIKYFGFCFTPSILVLFILQYCNFSKYVNLFTKIVLFSFPVFFLTILYTNNFHNLFFEFISLDLTGSIPLVAFKPGLFLLICSVFFYSCVFIAFIFLVLFFFNNNKLLNIQSGLIFLSILVPFLFNILFLLGYKPIGNIDLLEFSLIVFSIFVLINLLFFSLFKVSQFNKLKILELLEQGIIVLNNKFEILYFNNSTEKYFNQNKSIELGANLLTSIDLSKEAVEILNKKIDKKCLQEINNNIIEVSIKYYYETEQYFILEFNDLTISQSTSVDFLKKIKDLEESNSLKDKLFSIITHDLKSPFASLLSMFHIADEDNFTHDDFKSFLPKITESIDYTSTLIDNLLSWCRSQINSIDFEIEEVKLKNIVDNEVSFFTFKANEKELKIVNELNTNDFVLADKDSLQLVFRNLFSNAIKFCKVGDSITVSYQVKEDRGTIVFKDTGVGMKNDSVEKLFGNEIFTTYGTNNEKGTGLGLLLSKDYVEKSGGQIFVESEIGIGTTFFITFPTK